MVSYQSTKLSFLFFCGIDLETGALFDCLLLIDSVGFCFATGIFDFLPWLFTFMIYSDSY